MHLTWTEDPRHTLTVCWTTDRRGAGRVAFRPAAGGDAWTEVPARTTALPASAGFQHVAVIRGLEPGRPLHYRVSADPGHDPPFGEVFATRTAPADEAPVEAVFLCDVGLAGRPDGTTDDAPAVLRALAARDPLCVLGGGDYAYANRDPRHLDPGDAVGAWFEQMQPLLARAPFLAQLGNHEIELGERLADWTPRLPAAAGSPSGLSRSFELGAAHVVGLHAPGRAPGADELAWLEADLRGPAARRAAFRIVFQHAPPVAHGRSHPARPAVRALMPLFARLGVDLHLAGHDQSFERTHALRADGGLVMPRVDARGDVYPAGEGVVYAKVSPAGKLSDRGRGFSRLPEAAPPEIAARSDTGHHWARVIVRPDALRVEIDRLAGRDRPVETIDAFTIARIDRGPERGGGGGGDHGDADRRVGDAPTG